MKKFYGLLLLLGSFPAWGATCTVTEFERLPLDPAGRLLPLGSLPPIASQLVTYTTSTQSTAFGSVSNFIRIQCSANAHFAVGSNPTATTADPRIAAGAAEYFHLTTRGVKIAIYDGAS